MPDSSEVFKHELFENFDNQVVITVQLLDILQKEYVFKLPVKERVERVAILKDTCSKLVKAGKLHKAEKMYRRVYDFFVGKDARGNFCEENVETEEYKADLGKLDMLAKLNYTNLAVVTLKRNKFDECIKYATEALEVDPKNTKALFLQARSYTAKTEYDKAIACLNSIVPIAAEMGIEGEDVKKSAL